MLVAVAGADPLDIDAETKRILLRSRQATSRPSPETSPAHSPFGSTDDLSDVVDTKKGAADYGEREVELQEIDPQKYYEFGAEIWRCECILQLL